MHLWHERGWLGGVAARNRKRCAFGAKRAGHLRPNRGVAGRGAYSEYSATSVALRLGQIYPTRYASRATRGQPNAHRVCHRPFATLGAISELSNRRLCWGLAIVLALGVPLAWGADAPIKNLRIPLEHYEDGKVRTQITAGTAAMQEGGSVDAQNVRIEIFGRDGVVEGLVEAGDCFVDREKQMVTSTNTVRVTQKGVSITGVGFEWQAADQSFKILTHARVVFIREPGSKFLKMP